MKEIFANKLLSRLFGSIDRVSNIFHKNNDAHPGIIVTTGF